MILSAVLVIGTGIGESNPAHTGLASHHIVAASLFLLSACVHGWYNRKAMLGYLEGFSWRWAVMAAGLLVLVFGVGHLFG